MMLMASPLAGAFAQLPVCSPGTVSMTDTENNTDAAKSATTADATVDAALNSYPDLPPDLVDHFSPREWEQRCALAAAYRVAYLHDWHENVFNHITLVCLLARLLVCVYWLFCCFYCLFLCLHRRWRGATRRTTDRISS